MKISLFQQAPYRWESATTLLADSRVDISALVSRVLPVQEAQRGFNACLGGQTIKVLFELES